MKLAAPLPRHCRIDLRSVFATQLKNGVDGESRLTQYGFQTVVGGYFGG